MGARDQIEHSMSERKAAAGAALADKKGLNHARSAKQGEMNALQRDEHDDPTGDGTEVPSKSPRKRRKVNHACLYCRRSHMTCDLERPCTRCIKRNIGHLCHDEPRDTDFKKRKKPSATRSQDKGKGTAAADESDDMASSDLGGGSAIPSTMGPPPPTFSGTGQRDDSGFQAGDMLRQSNPLALVPPDAPSGLQPGALSHSANVNQFAGFSDAWLTAQNFQDMNTYNPNYMIGPEVTHEFNLLNEILHSSLPDDGGIAPDETQNVALARPGTSSDMLPPSFVNMHGLTAHDSLPAVQVQGGGSMLPPPPHVETISSSHKNNNSNNNITGSSNNIKAKQGRVSDKDKTREYYLQAADPSGDDNPEERMARVLKAKYEAGLLKPFNYINGYARLGKYLDGHIAPSSKQKILRTINQFRPKFREKAQALTDMQLVYVEMWFEKQLMDYDRVFASMAVPACCWRRTGEIFRGNKEMAELINVPVDQLRDGKIALHEILTEESLVRYWEEFGTIAFDPAHDTLLTACSLKNPSDTSNHPIVKSCFSFAIRRDEHKLPALIVGNFLPHDPPPQ